MLVVNVDIRARDERAAGGHARITAPSLVTVPSLVTAPNDPAEQRSVGNDAVSVAVAVTASILTWVAVAPAGWLESRRFVTLMSKRGARLPMPPTPSFNLSNADLIEPM